MAFESDRRYMSNAQAEAAQIDVGLRHYMLGVYNYMASGLALTGIVALLVAHSPQLSHLLLGTQLRWVVILAPLAMVFILGFRLNQMRASTAKAMFWAFSALMGASLASVFLVYTQQSIAQTFFITAASFAGLSLYGYTTKRDLSAFGAFLVMGLWGLIIASVVNLFLHSTGLQFVVSAAGVLIFAGLTAWDTQKVKEMYWEADGSELAAKKSVMAALTLYLDFINLFMFMLQFLGVQRRD
jgi:FtsH-binding integral membrane protein